MLIALLSLCALASAGKRGPALKYGRMDEDLNHPCAHGECGEMLNLTPMLHDADGNLTSVNHAAAQDAALVTPPIGNLTSYSGFFTTDKAVDNNMFWWYFPAQNGDIDAPLVIWLQGGPGGASTFGLFAEMGPIMLEKDASDPTGFKVLDRATSWNKDYGMLFIDNPVGAGFSYTTQDGGYCTDTKQCVARNLYAVLEQFYTMFPKQLDVGLWVTVRRWLCRTNRLLACLPLRAMTFFPLTSHLPCVALHLTRASRTAGTTCPPSRTTSTSRTRGALQFACRSRAARSAMAGLTR